MAFREITELVMTDLVKSRKYSTREIMAMGISKKAIKRLYRGGWLAMFGTHDGKVQRTYMIIS